MIKLSYQKNGEFTSLDMFDYVPEPEVLYRYKKVRPLGWTDIVMKFLNDKFIDVEAGLEIVAMSLISVEQEGQIYVIDSVQQARELMETRPGDGEDYIKALAITLYNRVLDYESDRLGNLSGPPIDSETQNSNERLPSVAKVE